MLLLIIGPNSKAYAKTSISVYYRCSEPNTITSAIKPHLQIKNNTSDPIQLSSITIRYWFQLDDDADNAFNCDYSAIPPNYLTHKFTNQYVEIGFKESAGVIEAGSNTGNMQLRFNKSNWSTYNQEDDYSFNPSFTTYKEHVKITGYVNGILSFGTEPDGSTAEPHEPQPIGIVGDDDWLHVEGNQIVDQHGNPVWLTGTNWFGFNTGTNCFDGIWSCNMKKALDEMANRGINIIRVPISTEILHQWSTGVFPNPNVNTYANPELEGKNSLEIFDAFLQVCKRNGMKVMLDVHSAKTDAMGHFHPLWYHGNITTEMFYETWEWVANRYKDDDTILAFDLQNEPHGKAYQDDNPAIWNNSNSINNWKKAAQTCANRILAINPNILIIVEGIETYPKEGFNYSSNNAKNYYGCWWGGNLRGVKDYPIDLGQGQNQLVYSPHDYGPDVYKQKWFYPGFNKSTLYQDVWKDNWAYIMEDNIAPLFVGEWGGSLSGDNGIWMHAIREFMIQNKIHHTFWCFNANSGDTGGLVDHSFKIWDEVKYNFLKSALWQNSQGKFIGLDHKQPLGSNGITVTEFYNH